MLLATSSNLACIPPIGRSIVPIRFFGPVSIKPRFRLERKNGKTSVVLPTLKPLGSPAINSAFFGILTPRLRHSEKRNETRSSTADYGLWLFGKHKIRSTPTKARASGN